MAGLVESDPAAKDAATSLRILHLSDTHGLHNSLEQAFPFPPADILIHTGDFTDGGREDEFRSFDEWLASLRPRYRDIIVISGNHEYKSRNSPALTVKGGLKALLPNGPTAVLEHESAFVRGLHVFGSGWVPGHKSASPGDSSHPGSKVVQHRFDEIPGGVDLLLTHGAPHGILDCCEEATLQWGGSFALRAAVERVKPTA